MPIDTIIIPTDMPNQNHTITYQSEIEVFEFLPNMQKNLLINRNWNSLKDFCARKKKAKHHKAKHHKNHHEKQKNRHRKLRIAKLIFCQPKFKHNNILHKPPKTPIHYKKSEFERAYRFINAHAKLLTEEQKKKLRRAISCSHKKNHKNHHRRANEWKQIFH